MLEHPFRFGPQSAIMSKRTNAQKWQVLAFCAQIKVNASAGFMCAQATSATYNLFNLLFFSERNFSSSPPLAFFPPSSLHFAHEHEKYV
jgi:hypothetical protein